MVVAVTFVSYVLVEFMPGDAASRLEMNADLSPETIASFRAHFGLDQPLLVRYGRWIARVVAHGDFGISMETGLPATTTLFGGGRLAWTVLISLTTLIWVWSAALALGVAAAARPGGVVDRAAGAVALLGISIPGFLVGLVLLFFLVVVFRVGGHGLGVGGLLDADALVGGWTWARVANLIWHLWPVWLVTGVGSFAGWWRQIRGNLLDALEQPWAQAARANGVEERRILRHALRHAMNPLLSMMGLSLPYLVSGSLVAAVVFDLPTVERAFWLAIQSHDGYVVMAGLTFFTASLALGNLLADGALALLDPRIRRIR